MKKHFKDYKNCRKSKTRYIYNSFKSNHNVIKHMKVIVIYSYQLHTWIPFAQIEHSYIPHTQGVEVRV